MPTLDPQELFELGRTLAPLRDDGVLIIGSGFTTHNLREAIFGDVSGAAPQWGREFDSWAKETVEAGDIDSILNFRTPPRRPCVRTPAPSTSRRCSWRWVRPRTAGSTPRAS